MKKKGILCIDDSNTALLVLEYALEKAGYKVFIAEGVTKGIQIIEKQSIDLIFLDLSMPAISGYDFLKMRDELKIQDIPVIVISAFDSDETRSVVRKLGASDFISKPINIEMIIETVKEYLNR
ncbi:MAG: response regulator [Bacteroidales bacterium]|nr:response regulator [Bacteroidales bacterium]